LNDKPPGGKRRPQNDNHPRTDPGARPAGKTQLIDDLVMGVRFYSRLPVGDRPHERPELSRIAMALPFAGLVIGIGPALLLAAASLLGLPKLFAAGLAVAAALAVTGAMAEDALADAADGLFGGSNVERRLEIMRDSRHGTFGVAALCLYLLLRVAALAALAAIQPLTAAAIWLAAMLMARSGSLYLTLALPPARPDGLSASVGRVTPPAFAMGAIFALILALVLGAPGAGLAGFLVAAALAAGTAWGWTWLCRRLVGGQTGDLIGALQALLEIAALTGFLLLA
jgi:adenosylcobinamide-GDP ribazoletransferase